MRFEWDEQKRLSNLEKRGLDFWGVWAVFEDAHVAAPSAYGGSEPRSLAIGVLEGRCVTVVYTLERQNRQGRLLQEGET